MPINGQKWMKSRLKFDGKLAEHEMAKNRKKPKLLFERGQNGKMAKKAILKWLKISKINKIRKRF